MYMCIYIYIFKYIYMYIYIWFIYRCGIHHAEGLFEVAIET